MSGDEEYVDNYGFLKPLNMSYDKWEVGYGSVLKNRSNQWRSRLQSNNLALPKPTDSVKRLIRSGVPADIRSKVWLFYSGAQYKMEGNSGRYENYLRDARESKAFENIEQDIGRDMPVLLPDNVYFNESIATPDRSKTNDEQESGVQQTEAGPLELPKLDLSATAIPNGKSFIAPPRLDSQLPSPPTDVPPLPASSQPAKSGDGVIKKNDKAITENVKNALIAFLYAHPKVEYSSHICIIACMLSLVMDTEEQVFWMLATVVGEIMQPNTYTLDEPRLAGRQAEQKTFWWLMKLKYPAVERRLSSDVPDGHFSLINELFGDWFSSMFAGILPPETMFRVWDSLFYEGSKVLHRTALAIIGNYQYHIRLIDNPSKIVTFLRNAPKILYDCENFNRLCFNRFLGSCGSLPMTLIAERRSNFLSEIENEVNSSPMDISAPTAIHRSPPINPESVKLPPPPSLSLPPEEIPSPPEPKQEVVYRPTKFDGPSPPSRPKDFVGLKSIVVKPIQTVEDEMYRQSFATSPRVVTLKGFTMTPDALSGEISNADGSLMDSYLRQKLSPPAAQMLSPKSPSLRNAAGSPGLDECDFISEYMQVISPPAVASRQLK